MPKLRVVSARDLLGFFKSYGFEIVSQKGSHIKIRRVVLTKRQNLIIPNHDPIKKGTFREILEQASLYIPKTELHEFFWTE